MLKQQINDKLNQHLGELLKNNPLQDAEKNIKAIIVAILNKLDLVTREEFDVAQKLLRETRSKLDEIEIQLQELTSSKDK